MARLALARLAPALLLACSACGFRGEAPGIAPRHILLVTVDSLRADHLSAMTYPRATSRLAVSPEQRARGQALSFDDMADQGVLFTNAFAPQGQALPSLGSLFTGMHPLELGLLDDRDRLSEGAETLAELLGRAGFQTAGFTANPLLAPGSGMEQGFWHYHPARSADRDLEVVRAALDWVQGRDLESGPPLFLWVHLNGPHLPYDPEPIGALEFRTLFTDPDHAGPVDGSRAVLDGRFASGEVLNGLDLHHVVALYDGEIARVSALFGRLALGLSVMREGSSADLLSQMVVVIAGVHGEELYQHNRYWGHARSPFGSVLHVPLILRHPGSLTGRRVFDQIVELQDLAPTLLEWFDLPVPEEMRGRSLLSLVHSWRHRSFPERPAMGGWRDQIFSLRTPRWRLVHNPGGAEPGGPPPGPYSVPQVALFDLLDDPLERFDVSIERPDLVAELTARIAAWKAGLRAPPERPPGHAPELDRALNELGYGGAPEAPR